MELGMRLDRAAILAGAERVPLLLWHRQVEARQQHDAVGQPRDSPQQARHRGCGIGDPGRHEEALRRMLPPGRSRAVEQAVAPIGLIDPAHRRQLARPALQHRGEDTQRALPMLGEIGLDIELGERADRHVLDHHLIERAAQRLRQPHRLRGIDRLADTTALLRHQPRQHHPPHHRIDRRRHRRTISRIKR